MDMGPEVEAHRPHHAHRHRRHGRAEWLEAVLGVSAIVISLFSAGLTVQHGRAMERMVEASTWPYVTLGDSNGDEQGRPIYRVVMINQGVGPAKIRSLHIRYKGRPTKDVFELAAAVARDAGIPGHSAVVHSDAVVIPARETVNVLNVAGPVSSPALISAFNRARGQISIEACYCSIFDECWITNNEAIDPRKVKSCPAPAPAPARP